MSLSSALFSKQSLSVWIYFKKKIWCFEWTDIRYPGYMQQPGYGGVQQQWQPHMQCLD